MSPRVAGRLAGLLLVFRGPVLAPRWNRHAWQGLPVLRA